VNPNLHTATIVAVVNQIVRSVRHGVTNRREYIAA
ncbi:uncharacterized protein METZ01_LOCUS256027, partial [marine metagenome]